MQINFQPDEISDETEITLETSPADDIESSAQTLTFEDANDTNCEQQNQSA